MRRTRWFALLVCVLAAVGAPAQADSPAERKALVLEIAGPIGPATSDYVVRGIEKAAQSHAALVILQMDTPGGLDTAMRDIIKAILASPVPVVTWVAPSGSRAASAGTYILYASHVAAMAPATNIGAATPVAIGGSSREPEDRSTDGSETKNRGAPADAHKAKAVNDAVAYIRGLAERRGRNADWAERAVREAASLTAERAVEDNVADFIAADMGELLAGVNGRTVSLQDGEAKIDTDGVVVERVEPDWRTEFLAVITSPTVAYMLLLAGIYGLLFEGYNPGAILPGVVGAICALLALYAFQILPVNYAGLALIILGIGLMIAEVFVPSFGALGIGGIVAFVAGSVILMDTDVPGYGLPARLIGSIALAGGTVVLGIVWFAVRAHRRPVVSGREQMIGSPAVAAEDFESRGQVRAHGELWQAKSDQPVQRGQALKITAIHGLVLTVEPSDTTEN